MLTNSMSAIMARYFPYTMPSLGSSPGPTDVLVRRKLAVAVSEEDYNLAAQLNSKKQALSQELPAISQYTFHQLQQLQIGIETGSLLQQLSAVRSLGITHDSNAAPPECCHPLSIAAPPECCHPLSRWQGCCQRIHSCAPWMWAATAS